MGLRPGHCYNDPDKHRPYTRIAVKVHRKNFIGAVPGLRTRQFNMGNPGKDYDWIVDLVSTQKRQIRDNSIESARMMINRYLVKHVGKDAFFMRIRIYPHHILRENKLAQGAGADRVSKGMSLAFGKPIGRAARIRAGKVLVSVLVEEKNVEHAKKALKRVAAYLSCGIKVKAHQNVESMGSRSKKEKIIEEKVEEEKVEEEEEKEEAEKKEEEKGKEAKEEKKEPAEEEEKKDKKEKK